MNVYIPLVGIAQFLLGYALIGLILFVPLVYWQARFISSYRTAFQRSAWEGVKVWRGILMSLIAWPIMLGYTIKTEIEYRKKGYL